MTRRRNEERVRDAVVGPDPLLVWNGAVTRLPRIGVAKLETSSVSAAEMHRRVGRAPIRSPRGSVTRVSIHEQVGKVLAALEAAKAGA